MGLIIGGQTLREAEQRVLEQVLAALRPRPGEWVPVADCLRHPNPHHDEMVIRRLHSLGIFRAVGVVVADGKRGPEQLRLAQKGAA